MKKIIIAFIGMSVMFVSCMSKEEKQAKENEELATSCVRATLKCPSSMQVSHIEQLAVTDTIEFDTLYHISQIVRRTEWLYGTKFEYEITKLEIDSIRELKRIYPAYTHCSVYFDAQNSYGAMVRENETVAIVNGYAILFRDFFAEHYETPEIKTWSVEPIVYTDNFKYGLEYLVEEGEWVSLSDLFENK